ncbi:MAG: nicotinate phosphoribosyltransferase, partial [Acidimicrobiia bacterium]
LNQIAIEAPRYGVDADSVIGRLVYGVGTKMATSDGDPSLDGVYKLVAIHRDGDWVPAIKLSDTPAKVINPGRKHVVRIYDERGAATADVLAQKGEELGPPLELHHPVEPGVRRILEPDQVSGMEELLERRDIRASVDERAVIDEARKRRDQDLERLDAGVRRILNPHVYHVSLSRASNDLKQELIAGTLRR